MGNALPIIIAKNQREAFHVDLREYRGKPFVDLRVHALTDNDETVPTPKGVAIRPALLPEIIRALQAAEHEVRARGLLHEGEATHG